VPGRCAGPYTTATVPRRNRVDPWSDLHAVPARGMFTGNRGCLVDDTGEVVRHHRGDLWITCLTEFRGWRHPLAAPRVWTPVFFLDDAVGLAAGHRPCGLCRRDAYVAYRDAVGAASAAELNRRLARERLRRGRGVDRAGDRLLWSAPIDDLPTGTVIAGDGGHASLVLPDRLLRFSFSGWEAPVDRPSRTEVRVLTPPTSVAALSNGFTPTLWPTAHGGPDSGNPSR
jgi:hypothetical protein